MTHTFEYFPIETAPRDRWIMLFCPDSGWLVGSWYADEEVWVTAAEGTVEDQEEGFPVHYWAEIEAMKPGGADAEL